MDPLVSICIPAFDSARWLAATLDSALAQTWPRCEIIVVDDGSRDETLATARAYEQRGVRVVTQANAGAASARNHALKLARGDYVKFLDADDLLSPETVALQIAALRSAPRAIAYGEWARFIDDPRTARFAPRAGWHDAAPVDWLIETWTDGQPMMQCGQYLLPRTLLEDTGGWDERLSLIDDFEFFTRVTLASERVVFTPGARLYYRSALAGSLSNRKSAKAWRSAALSTVLATTHLLARENSLHTRAAAVTMLQTLIHDMYPSMPDLIADLEKRVRELGGSDLAPLGGKTFLLLRRIVGWKAARRLQILAGKWPKPTRE